MTETRGPHRATELSFCKSRPLIKKKWHSELCIQMMVLVVTASLIYIKVYEMSKQGYSDINPSSFTPKDEKPKRIPCQSLELIWYALMT
jgi:hypothetical protein